MWALESRSLMLATAAVCFGGIGLWLKQTAGFGAAGAVAALLLAGHWRWTARLWLVAAGALTTWPAVPLLFSYPYRRLYTADLPSSHGVQYAKLLQWAWSAEWYRGALYACLPFALAVYLARAPGSAVRRLLVVWFFIGVFEALPALVAYCKTMGDWNNFI